MPQGVHHDKRTDYMLLLGIDIGTSSVKVSVVDATTQQTLATAFHPETEREIRVSQPGWAEQDPSQWWLDTIQAIRKVHTSGNYEPSAIGAIGISYQMHGLVLVNRQQQVLRDAIIWCDSRAIPYGEAAWQAIGPEKCRLNLLNSPGNFTAAKLAWVKEQEPQLYEQSDRLMLPGDYIAMCLTGTVTSTPSMLSEGIFWDFHTGTVSEDVMRYFDFPGSIIPPIQDVFSVHGTLQEAVAADLRLRTGIPVSYKAGDQPNNALSLGALAPGDVAATAGTSGVIYAVTDQLLSDPENRVNTFAHVNYTPTDPSLGVLLCINGTGIANKWIRNIAGPSFSYVEMNTAAVAIPPGSEGLLFFPFGNGAERMLGNKQVQAHLLGIDLNRHHAGHLFRAVQEGISFSFRYGLDILRENGLQPAVVKAGMANMFLSEPFTRSFVNATGLDVELYDTDGSKGAALGAGIGAGVYRTPEEAFNNIKPIRTASPDSHREVLDAAYQRWKEQLHRQILSTQAFYYVS